jgi:DNA-binding response OmpR family regulator
MLTALMRVYGIDATCVQSAADAWVEIKKKSFHLYVVDGWLPRVDGFEFCRQIRKSGSKTPILFYSGAAYDVDRQKGMAAGANGYVAKPDVEGLIEAIGDLIAEAKPGNVAARWVNGELREADTVAFAYASAR